MPKEDLAFTIVFLCFEFFVVLTFSCFRATAVLSTHAICHAMPFAGSFSSHARKLTRNADLFKIPAHCKSHVSILYLW